MKIIPVRLTPAELDHMIHLILEDGKESAYGDVKRYLARGTRIRNKLLRARYPTKEAG